MNTALKNCKSLAMFKTFLKKYILINTALKFTITYLRQMYDLLLYFMLLFFVLNVLSDVVLHSKLNLICFDFLVGLSLLFIFSSGTAFLITDSLLLSIDSHDLKVFFT